MCPLEAGAAYRREVGFLAQDPRFYDWMTGRETLRFVASTGADTSARDEAWIGKVLDIVGLDAAAAGRRTKTYSGGMRQRLGIAQAMVTKPSVLLLDEPVSALDPIGRREVLELMTGLKGETTIFYSTHILDDVQRVADSVAILDGGRLVRAAPTHELLESFTNDRLRVVLGGGRRRDRRPAGRHSPAWRRSRPPSGTATSVPISCASGPRTPSRSSATSRGWQWTAT